MPKGYCLFCKQFTELTDIRQLTAKNGRVMQIGTCKKCKRSVMYHPK